jgi:CBS domain-containing protein
MGLNAEIKSVVNWDAPSVDIEDNLRKVIKKMLEHKASALAVKVGDKVAGVVTDMDVMDCISKDESQSVESALGVMATAGVHHLLVAGEKTAGMVSVHDLLKLVVE